MEWIVAAISDPHIGDGTDADDCNKYGLVKLFEIVLTYGPNKIILTGDFFERWQCSLPRIMQANKGLFRAINIRLHDNSRLGLRIPEIEYIDGNHDPDVEENAANLALTLSSTNVTPHRDYFDYAEWRFLHGYQFGDIWNGHTVLRPVSHGITWVAGVIERIAGGWNENALVRTVSPARRKGKSLRCKISQKAYDYASKTGRKVCYGHIHDSDLSKDMTVVNVGCCIGDRADAVVIFSDGLVNPIHIERTNA